MQEREYGNGEAQGAPEPEGVETRAESMPSDRELMRKLELQVQEHHDAWLRAKAEADNIRKRAQTDIASAHKFALEGFASELLPVRDALEAALAADNSSLESLRQGVELTLKQITGVFEKAAIGEVDPIGQRFDPHRHQAMTTVPSDEPPNMVVQVLQKGYVLHDRVLRPALVAVSRARD
ncbi:MAG: nucleotide exchange factor GrpE [Burkholderiales bacterium]|nr:nucleotide exchange factor GrpE [Burkholderiales bacterium]